MSGGLTDELQQFIARHIDSVEKLEILVLLAGNAERLWTVEEVFQKIQSSQTSVLRRLRELQVDGFLERDGDGKRFRYQPKSSQLTENTMTLASAYQERRIKVIEAIFSKSDDQLRRFSDAFRLRKEDDE
jgi:hypothetical protein